MEIIGYLLAVLMGISLGVLGGGGSMLTIPVLVYFFGVNPVAASSYSLCIVGITSFSGSLRSAGKNRIDPRIILSFAFPSVITIFFARQFLLPRLPDEFLFGDRFRIGQGQLMMSILALVMISSAWLMLKGRKDKKLQKISKPSWYYGLLLPIGGFLSGLITGLLGIGGGFLIIPVLVIGFRLPMKKAIAASLIIITVNSLLGFLFSIGSFEPDMKLFASITLLAVSGILVGTHLSTRINAGGLRKLFGIFLLLVATMILVQEIIFW